MIQINLIESENGEAFIELQRLIYYFVQSLQQIITLNCYIMSRDPIITIYNYKVNIN